MQRNKRVTAMLMAMIMMLGIILPIRAETLDYIISIETAEDFFEMMKYPNHSYRLEQDIDLGLIDPIGYNRENGRITAFSGTLDGNGHTVSFQMKEVSGCSRYGLFAELQDAEITSLHVNGNMDLNLTEDKYCNVGMLAGYFDGTIGGGSVTGNLNVESSGGGAIVGGVVGCAASIYDLKATRIVETKVEVNTSIHASGTKYCSYYSIGSDTRPEDCFVYGSAKLDGNITYVTGIADGNECYLIQDITVTANKNLVLTAISSGMENDYVGTILVKTTGESGNSKVTGISGGTMNDFEGEINVVGNGGISTTLVMARDCIGAYVNGNGTLHGNGYVYGFNSCDSASMDGNLTAVNAGKVYGLYECDDAIFNGNIIYTNPYERSRLYGAYKGNRNQVNGNLSIVSTKDNAGVYGIIDCDHSSFTGKLYAKSPSTAHAIGACNAAYNVVSASIAVDTKDGSATGVSSPHSSFEGSISCPGGSATACGDYSIAKGSVRAQIVTATGAYGYFTGSLEAVHTYEKRSTSVSIGCAADASVVVRGGKNGASFSPGVYYKGNASIAAADGNIKVEAFKNSNITINHNASGVSGSVQSILEKADREDFAEVYWHRYAKEQNCTKDSHEYIEYGYHSFYKYCFQTVAGVSIKDELYNSPKDFGWNGSIDPVNLAYKPKLDPVNYIIQVTDSKGDIFENCRISIGGKYLYPEVDGSFLVDNGPSVISPLVVEMKGPGGIYTKVLTRMAYYPVPDRINKIRLEPNVNDLELLLVENGYTGVESGKTWGGILVEMAGKTVNLINNPMEISLTKDPGLFEYRQERLKNGNAAFTITVGKQNSDEDFEFIKNSSDFIDKQMEKLSSMIKGNKKWGKSLGKLSGIDFTVAGVGYGEFAFDKGTSTWSPVNGNFGMAVSGGKRLTYHFPQAAYLVYLTGAYELEGSGKLGLKKVAEDDSVEHVKTKPYGEIGLTGEAELAIGAGNRYLETYAEGGGKGQLNGTWTLPHKTAAESLALDLTLNGFFRWCVFGWAEQTFESKGRTFNLWPNNQASAMLAMNEEPEYSVLSRAYLNGTAKNRSVEDASTISIYPYAQMQMLELEDGRHVLVYTDDDVSRGDADRSTLRVKIGTKAEDKILWNDAMTIEDDGTADYGFTACASGNKVAVIWQDMTKTYEDGQNVDMDEVAGSVELTQAVVDCSKDVAEVERLASVNTGKNLCERMPMVYYGGNDQVRSVWVTCTDNNPAMVSEDTRYSIWLSEAFGEEGTLVADDLASITGMAILPNDLLWSTYSGDGSDLWLRNDSGEISCQKESGIYNLQSVNSRYIYTEGNVLYGGNGNYDTCRQSGYGEVNQNILRLSASGEVYYAISGLDSSIVYQVDGEVGRPVGRYDGYLSSYDIAGDQIVTVLRTGFEDTDTAKMFSQSRQTIEDIEIEVVCEDTTAAPDSFVEMTIGVHNNGTYKIEEIPIRIVAEDGTVLYEESYHLGLETGEETLIDLSVFIPTSFVPQNIEICVGSEVHTQHLGNSNLALYANWNKVNAGGVSVIIENNGHGEASGLIHVTDESGNLLVCDEVTIPQGETDILWMDFGKEFDKETKVTVMLQEYNALAYTGDNQVVLSIVPVKDDGQTDINPDPEKQNPFVDVFEQDYYYDSVLWAYYDNITAGMDAQHFVPGGYCTRAQAVTFLWRAAGMPKLTGTDHSFTDVKDGMFYTDAVKWAVKQGITSGYSPEIFAPDDTCTRSQIVSFLWRYAGCPKPISMECSFKDVGSQAYYYEAVLWAVEQGIASGYSSEIFAPDDTCTRAQIVTFLYRFLK